jgi:antitoxin CptB
MRELDLLLTRFLEERFDAIPEPDKAAFERLLEHPDQDILAWIIGGAPAPDPALERVVKAIRGVSR